MASYDFRIGTTIYYLVDVTHNQLSNQAFQYIKSLSFNMRKMYVLSYTENPTDDSVAVIVGDKVVHQNLSKRSPYEFVCIKENISSSADKVAVKHAEHYLNEIWNEQ